ncbi:hypothetical protein L861_01470 [Litchfieldella anticariensis FP35 = DSM 16096]|uniref:Uncharacterized protein n=1 Tax=Litchfieldella anticariensis (strain DSM 16096 / CECT 5854 / CIP 108499 / LMG 22089 / FP35) TaxID=1121939 RepID=S2KQ40_LITA3|nr:hypothetical protein L861_01470 [Halomonas anticariensis FP35 = DSM 16096]
MNDSENMYDLEADARDQDVGKNKFSIGFVVFLLITIILATLSSLASFSLALVRSGDMATAIGSVIGHSHLFPLMNIAIASFWKSMRNMRSRTKIYFCWSILTLLAALSQWAKYLTSGL